MPQNKEKKAQTPTFDRLKEGLLSVFRTNARRDKGQKKPSADMYNEFDPRQTFGLAAAEAAETLILTDRIKLTNEEREELRTGLQEIFDRNTLNDKGWKSYSMDDANKFNPRQTFGLAAVRVAQVLVKLIELEEETAPS